METRISPISANRNAHIGLVRDNKGFHAEASRGTGGSEVEGGERVKYVIEKNIPMPKNGAGANQLYPFSDMEIGDSFSVEKESFKKACQSASMFGAKHGKKFSGRQSELRIWRIK